MSRAAIRELDAAIEQLTRSRDTLLQREAEMKKRLGELDVAHSLSAPLYEMVAAAMASATSTANKLLAIFNRR
jgi:hypothetical protein